MRDAEEFTFETSDGVQLFYRAWLGAKTGKSIVLFHRGHEHSGRFQELVDALDLNDVNFFAWDCRGCGRSPGPRGDARNIAHLERDMEDFVRHLATSHQLVQEETVVLAHSVAAVVAGLWVLDYGPRLAGLVLATPALQVKLYVPFARSGLQALSAFGFMKTVASYVRGSALTHDKVQAQAYDQDPLISKEISTRLLLDLYRGAARLIRHASDIVTPTQVLVARADWVIKNKPIRMLFRKLSSARKEIKVYRGFFHAVFHEKDRAKVFGDVRRFVTTCFEVPKPDHSALLSADTHGPSAERFEWLQAGVPPVSPQNLIWTATRASMKTLGRASNGVRLGLRTGFSSGETLDYVYLNRPQGFTLFGKLVDFYYLNSIGWVCIRQRRVHLRQLLEYALDALSEQGPLRLADLAGGPGRYLLETLRDQPELQIDVIVRDLDQGGLARGRELAEALGEKRVSYRAGDACCPTSISDLGSLDLAVVSGLYELISNNQPVLRSLQGLAEVVKPGGFLIYTNQPSHPQLELIAETLTHGTGERWVMRCRSTAEMDELVRSCGFQKIQSLIDDHGIFSVALAQRMKE